MIREKLNKVVFLILAISLLHILTMHTARATPSFARQTGLSDIRYSNNTIALGKNLIYGLSINNSPTVQDGWNSTPTWGFPFATSSVAPTPAVSGARDAARAAAAIVLMTPGLSVIIDAIKESRRIFQRMNSYAI